MKRDLDLLRNILLKIESVPTYTILESDDFYEFQRPIYEIDLHIKLLVDCNYIEAVQTGCTCSSHQSFKIFRITSAGYDYLDSVRDADVWNETKKKLQSAGLSAALDVVKAVAASIITSRLGL